MTARRCSEVAQALLSPEYIAFVRLLDLLDLTTRWGACRRRARSSNGTVRQGDCMTRTLRITLSLLAAVVPDLRAQGPPATPLTCENCWPVECFLEGRWAVARPLRVVASPSDSTVAFRVAAGDSVDADSSITRVTQFGLAFMRRTFGRFRQGDTVVLLSEGSEGHFRSWHRGMERLDRVMWGDSAAPAMLVQPVKEEWWVRLSHGGQRGWTRLSRAPVEVTADC